MLVSIISPHRTYLCVANCPNWNVQHKGKQYIEQETHTWKKTQPLTIKARPQWRTCSCSLTFDTLLKALFPHWPLGGTVTSPVTEELQWSNDQTQLFSLYESLNIIEPVIEQCYYFTAEWGDSFRLPKWCVLFHSHSRPISRLSESSAARVRLMLPQTPACTNTMLGCPSLQFVSHCLSHFSCPTVLQWGNISERHSAVRPLWPF